MNGTKGLKAILQCFCEMCLVKMHSGPELQGNAWVECHEILRCTTIDVKATKTCSTEETDVDV